MSPLEQNLKKLQGYLGRYTLEGIQHRIAGQDVKGSAGTFKSVSPVDKSEICSVARGDAKDIDKAAQAAKSATSDPRT